LFLHLVILEVPPAPHLATACPWQSHAGGGGVPPQFALQVAMNWFLQAVILEVPPAPHLATACPWQLQVSTGVGLQFVLH